MFALPFALPANATLKLIAYGVLAVSLVLLGMGIHKTFSDRKIRALQNEFGAYREAATAAALVQEQKFRQKEAALMEAAENERKKTSSAMRALNARFDSLRSELAATRDKLKAAEAAPAECRDYAAPPSQLSTLHATMVAELAKHADAIVFERNTCIAQYEAAREAMNSTE
jgi:chromosome segregation ATPase